MTDSPNSHPINPELGPVVPDSTREYVDEQLGETSPEMHPWLTKEARDDELLMILILDREALFDQGIKDGTIDVHDPSVRSQMDRLTQKIEERKRELGIDPSIQP